MFSEEFEGLWRAYSAFDMPPLPPPDTDSLPRRDRFQTIATTTTRMSKTIAAAAPPAGAAMFEDEDFPTPGCSELVVTAWVCAAVVCLGDVVFSASEGSVGVSVACLVRVALGTDDDSDVLF